MFDDDVANTIRGRTIGAQPQAVWDLLADFGALSTWADGTDHSCVLNHGPDGGLLGTTRRVQLGRTVVVERVVDFDPPEALAYSVEGLPKRLGKLANRWTLRPRGSATEVTITSTVDVGSGPISAATEWAVGRAMAKQSESMLAGLARRLETSHG